MRIKEIEGIAMLKFYGVIIFLVGIFNLLIQPILVGIGMFLIGYIRQKQINKRF